MIQNKKDNYSYYGDVLSNDVQLKYLIILDKFKQKEISYSELENMFTQEGVTIKPYLRDFTKQMMTIEDARKIEERISSYNYIYNDINYFILDNKIFFIFLKIDGNAINLLAKKGNKHYIEATSELLKSAYRNTLVTKENFAKATSEYTLTKPLKKRLFKR